MPRIFARCPDGKCQRLSEGFPMLRHGGDEKDPEQWVYGCTPDKEDPCQSTKDQKCRCFVVVGHFKTVRKPGAKEDTAELTEDEVYYPNYRPGDETKGKLTKAKAQKDYKDNDQTGEYWSISCQCLKVDEDNKPYWKI
ncbi:MAG TPA: hypothetical protein VEC02_06085 [Nitrososphaerales archaeon]|nr:hypothetical protein [Nitrososphaerales archaeon]